MNVLIELIAFAVAIGVLVVVHEYGHYSIARLCGVKVLRFSIGFGAVLVRHTSRRTGTEWTLSALPLGGYVQMLDKRDSGPDGIAPTDLPQTFNCQSVWKRIAIVAAGPIANFLLAILLFSMVFATGVTEPAAVVAVPTANTVASRAGFDGGEAIVSIRAAQGSSTEPVRSWSDLRWKLLSAIIDHRQVILGGRTGGETYDFHVDLSGFDQCSTDDYMSKLGFEPGGGALSISAITPGSAAEQAGLRPGDRIVAFDGKSVISSGRFIDTIKSHAGRPLALRISRGGVERTLSILPHAERDTTPTANGGQVGRIGAALSMHMPTVDVRYSLLESAELGVLRTWSIAAYSLKMFGWILTGEASLKTLSGPVTIADYAGKSVKLGLPAFLLFLALVSISFGVLNLLPIPVLDGGHLLYYWIEATTGKAVSERWELILQRMGLICIVALSAIALCNDLSRLLIGQ
ncbi:MAG: RIP metalloprotease RseP [Burkholderia sp.]|nr:MAG: Regulator of sigma-E protease RseP [Burkholderia gladioli]